VKILKINAIKLFIIRLLQGFFLLLLILKSEGVLAHHSTASYDQGKTIEIKGTVTKVKWANPHVQFVISQISGVGVRQSIWQIELTSISTLRRRNVDAGFLKVGDFVSVYGNPARDKSTNLYAKNILLQNKVELILDNSGQSRWSKENIKIVGVSQNNRQGDKSQPSLGLFRVWSTPIKGDPFWEKSYPLTDSAVASVKRFINLKTSVTVNCSPKGMPTIMQQPYAMQFSQKGEQIQIDIEEYDTVRIVDMRIKVARSSHRKSLLGYSVGHWEGQTLVVKTTDLSWKYFDRDGVPLSSKAEINEYFTPSVDGSRLDYEIVTTDPENFTLPVKLHKYWLWYPEVKVFPYNCKS